jgi:vacuolar iron transporter family protein
MYNDFRQVIRDFVFGMEDGLVSNLGLVLGVYIGGGGHFAVILAGLASMFAGAFSMSAGSYLSAKAQREVYEQEIISTKKYLRENPHKCIAEMKTILRKEGLNKQGIDAIFKGNKNNHQHPKFVCNYLVQKKVGISKEKFDLPFKNSLTMFLSFIAGSLFPVLPFIFSTGLNAVVIATTLTIIILFVVGVAKTVYTKRNWFKSGLEIVLVGVAAGVIGYLIGLVLSGIM